MAKKTGIQNKVWLLIIGVVLVVVAVAGFMVTRPEPKNMNYRDPQTYIGLTEAEAVERAQTGGLETRVIGRNGKDEGGTDDLRPDSVILILSDGKVSSAEFY